MHIESRNTALRCYASWALCVPVVVAQSAEKQVITPRCYKELMS